MLDSHPSSTALVASKPTSIWSNLRNILQLTLQEPHYLAAMSYHSVTALPKTLSEHSKLKRGKPRSLVLSMMTGLVRSVAVAHIHSIPKARKMTNALLVDLILDPDAALVPVTWQVHYSALIQEEVQANLSKLRGYAIPPEKHASDYILEGEFIGNKQDIQLLLQQRYQGKVILYVHGGALFAGSPKTHRNLTWKYAKETQSIVFVVNYRKCPEHPFPASLHDVYAAYLLLTQPNHSALSFSFPMQTIDPRKMIVAGDSAGAGIAMSFLLYLKHVLNARVLSPTTPLTEGLIMPRAALLLSPWVDLTCQQSSWHSNEKTDFVPKMNFFQGMFEEGSPVLWYSTGLSSKEAHLHPLPHHHYLTLRPWFTLEQACHYQEHTYTPEEQATLLLEHPLMSPLHFHDPSDMPPTLILNGDAEVLRDEGAALYQKLLSANPQWTTTGVHATLIHAIYHNMPHVFQIFDDVSGIDTTLTRLSHQESSDLLCLPSFKLIQSFLSNVFE